MSPRKPLGSASLWEMPSDHVPFKKKRSAEFGLLLLCSPLSRPAFLHWRIGHAGRHYEFKWNIMCSKSQFNWKLQSLKSNVKREPQHCRIKQKLQSVAFNLKGSPSGVSRMSPSHPCLPFFGAHVYGGDVLEEGPASMAHQLAIASEAVQASKRDCGCSTI